MLICVIIFIFIPTAYNIFAIVIEYVQSKKLFQQHIKMAVKKTLIIKIIIMWLTKWLTTLTTDT